MMTEETKPDINAGSFVQSSTTLPGSLPTDVETRNFLLQQALLQAAAVRAQLSAKAAPTSCAATTTTGCPISVANLIRSDGNVSSAPKRKIGAHLNENVAGDNGTSFTLKKHMDVIKAHPLFPVLEAMLRKCEEATWTLSASSTDIGDVLELLKPIAESQKWKAEFGERDEVDRLIFDAILALRVNLLELSKVADLCSNFRSRYIQCIRQRLSQERLLGFGNDSDDDDYGYADGRNSPSCTNDRHLGSVATLTTANGTVSVSLDIPAASSSTFANAMMNDKSSSGNSNFSQESFMYDEDDGSGTYSRKSSLPRKAVEVLKLWLFQHVAKRFQHPYPSEAEKQVLSGETGLNLVQINNWFINARRRLLPRVPSNSPPVNSAAPDESCSKDQPPKAKKIKLQLSNSSDIEDTAG